MGKARRLELEHGRDKSWEKTGGEKSSIGSMYRVQRSSVCTAQRTTTGRKDSKVGASGQEKRYRGWDLAISRYRISVSCQFAKESHIPARYLEAIAARNKGVLRWVGVRWTDRLEGGSRFRKHHQREGNRGCFLFRKKEG